jgi:predicted metal-binding protein
MSAHTIFVCTTCASKWENSKRVGESGGEKLLKRLQTDYQNWKLNTEFVIQPVECMSACSRSCIISFACPGKTTYLFGDISQNLTSEEVNGVFTCADIYHSHPEGSLPWSQRPEPLKKGILARIPAVAMPKAPANIQLELCNRTK